MEEADALRDTEHSYDKQQGRGQSYLEERNERRKWKTLIKSSTPDPELRTTKALNTVITT